MKKFRIGTILLALLLVFSFAFTSCKKEATLDKIEISKNPKTQYILGETLDLTGGELTATFSDGTTKIVSLTDSEVTVNRPNMNAIGEKTVAVTYKSKTATFKITVSEPKLEVTFDLNYDGAPTAQKMQVENGKTVTAPADPERANFAFLGWFIAAESNTKYNFATSITQNTTVYARWGHSVEFNLNYEGATSSVELVEAGDKVSEPANSPERPGFIFLDWYTTANIETEFDFNTAINANTVAYAGWHEVSSDTKIYTVTFNYNDGTEYVRTRQVIENYKVSAPVEPTLTGAEFEGWYKNAELTQAYDFNTEVTSDITLYAKWSADSYTVTFHFNHSDNNGIFTVVEDIQKGFRVSEPSTKPELTGYYFSGWYKNAACTEKVNFSDRINNFTHYYAKWLKEWEFQAEYTDFGNREAFGYSANGRGASAFIMKNNAELWGAHNGHWVANMHQKDLFVEFIIESDAEVFDAALVLRLSADFYDIVLHKDNFEINVNGEVIDYDFVAEITGAVGPDQGGIQNKRPFDNWEFLTNLHLVEGQNVIRFTMTEEKRYGEVGTMYATAPMMDCIYINTNANLSWNPITSNI